MKRTLYLSLSCLLLLGTLSMNSYAEIPEHTKIKPSEQSSIEHLYQEGEKAMQNGKWDEAITKYQLLNFAYPNNPYFEQARFSTALCYIKQQKPKEAEKILEAIQKDNPQSFKEFVKNLRVKARKAVEDEATQNQKG